MFEARSHQANKELGGYCSQQVFFCRARASTPEFAAPLRAGASPLTSCPAIAKVWTGSQPWGAAPVPNGGFLRFLGRSISVVASLLSHRWQIASTIQRVAYLSRLMQNQTGAGLLRSDRCCGAVDPLAPGCASFMSLARAGSGVLKNPIEALASPKSAERNRTNLGKGALRFFRGLGSGVRGCATSEIDRLADRARQGLVSSVCHAGSFQRSRGRL